ncbi:MAG: alpha-hydroxy-acid oxidizing protein [Flavobacteriales bacterium]|nr:alpha-hydroxy-acid oxidizing protein [Flavobacteriales bacterium]
MDLSYNMEYASIDDLRLKAKSKIPRFAFEYLDGGCNEDVNLKRNTDEIRDVQLIPQYLKKHTGSTMATELFGHTYDAPFGVSPVGLQGLMWPNAPEILAKAAFEHNLPFILSTVTTSSIERISEITEGRAWFQLYHPRETSLRDKLIERAEVAHCPVLVLLADVPTFGFRPKDIKNGLGMPPKMSLRNMLQICGRPEWALRTLINGQPEFKTMKPYMPKGLDLKQLGKYMNETFSGRLDEERIAPIRDKWKGKIVLKGVASEEDAEKAVKLGIDGLLVSNHGGRQIDSGESSIASMERIVKSHGDKIKIMMDSGIRSGADISRCLSAGAEFTFMGRSFMYSVAALGNEGGNHIMSMLKIQLQQVMEQVCCERVEDFPDFRVKD